jgi:phage baseplate assembly protein W
MSIADRITTSKQPVLYSDFLNNLDVHPLSNDIASIKNTESIKQSIRNLLLTNFEERFFSPNIGSGVYRTLFEPLDDFSMDSLKLHIEDTIRQYEPRAKLIGVNVYPNEPENSVVATIAFSIINTGQTDTLNLILRRVR